MRQNSTKNRALNSVRRGRAAVVAGGVCAALALGSTAAFAAGAHAQAPELFPTKVAAGTVTAMQNQATSQAAAAAAKRAVAKAGTGWMKPVSHYVLSAGFAQSGSHWAHKHTGQDFAVPTGTSVKAVHSGTIVAAGWGGAYGNNIVIKHGKHTFSQYAHLSRIEAHVGQKVREGQEIAKSGSTGNATGPHLHFEIRKTPYYGSAVEPLHFLRSHGVHV